jgi:hypothetical protein
MKIEELTSFIETLLRKRFHDTPEKQKIGEWNSRKISFACPVCGDSSSKVSKKRGNIYLDTKAYKCFNDGCMSYMGLAEFIAKMSKEHGIMLPSFLLEDDFTHVKKKRTENQLLRFLTSDTSELVTISQIINRFSLKRLDQVDESSAAYSYIHGRGLDLIKDFGDCLYTDISDNKVYIFNFDRHSGRVLGFSIRHLDENTDRKYIIKTYSDLSSIFSQTKISRDLVEDANFLNDYFNILNVDFSKPVLMTEGQFDSMLLENAIATSGASKARSILLNLGAKEASTIVFDRDKAGKAQMMNFIKQGYSVFLWNKAIGELKRRYSSEDDIIELSSTQRVKDMNDLFSFIHKRNPEYTVQDFNDWVNKHLSDSVFDLAYL